MILSLRAGYLVVSYPIQSPARLLYPPLTAEPEDDDDFPRFSSGRVRGLHGNFKNLMLSVCTHHVAKYQVLVFRDIKSRCWGLF